MEKNGLKQSMEKSIYKSKITPHAQNHYKNLGHSFIYFRIKILI